MSAAGLNVRSSNAFPRGPSAMAKRIGVVWWWGLAAILLLVVSAGAGALVIRQLSLRAELAFARRASAAGKHAQASIRLSSLAERWTNDGEVLILLGESELARAQNEPPERRAEAEAAASAALAAWARVPRSSPYFGRASLLRATRLINTGRYTLGEEILMTALADPAAAPRYELERALSRLYRFQGRFDEVREIIRGLWARSPTPAAELKELWTLDHSPMPVEAWRRSLEAADGDDDRVWLGRANVEITTGRFDEAAPWLDRCMSRRPDDPPFWQSRLGLAVATADEPGFWSAVAHLPAARFDPPAALKLRAWLMALRHDASAEERELRDLIAVDPGNTKALERLAVLMVPLGRIKESEEFHRQKAEIDRAHDKYRKMLFDGDDLSSRAELMAELTTTLGRPFDSQAWSILADAHLRDPGPTEASLQSPSRSPLPPALAARAMELSSPYKLITDSAGPKLYEQLAALAPTDGPVVAAVSQKVARSSKATIDFVDDAPKAGLRFVFDNGKTPERLLPETMSGGLGLIDYDGDGWLDVYCVQGGPLHTNEPSSAESELLPSDRLFRNRGDGTFVDVTEASGLDKLLRRRGYGLGVTVGDYDNDGHPDLFVSRLTTYALFRNRGDGTFEDVTERAGLAGVRDNPTSAAFADLDNDGDLDLYVCHYMVWDPENPRLCLNDKREYFYCDPSKVPPAPDHVFRNDGGRFVDVTESSGCKEALGRGLGVIAADLDGDGRIDLYVANDGTANYLFRNLGGFHFEEVGLQAGVAGGAQGGYQAGMGVACGDLDGDGRPELMVTNFYGEGTTLYQNLGEGLFADRSAASGIGLASRYLLGFGIAMADVTNDGLPDVMITNGHVNDNERFYHYAMPSRLYENRSDLRLADVSIVAGAPWEVLRVGRGLAAGDVDNDGRVDSLILAQNDPVAYFHNQSKDVGHYLTLRLEGTKSNRDGVGARVTISAGGKRQVSQRQGGGSYQSASDPRLHFGLGESDRVQSVEVRWPSGQIDRFGDVAADRGYLAREGEAKLLPLQGFSLDARTRNR
jgi:enediyne biosynthesis protein E4